MEKLPFYCQKCRAPNETGEGECSQCGTRLMLIVLPPALRHDEGMIPTFYEDHLLERVSLLELRMSQMMEQMKVSLDLINRESARLEKEKKEREGFLAALERAGPEIAETLRDDLEAQRREAEDVLDRKHRMLGIVGPILLAYSGRQQDLFARLIREGVRLLEDNEEKHAFSTLERAVVLSPDNLPLRTFVGRSLFSRERYDEAVPHFEEALALDARKADVILPLSFLYTDSYRSQKTKRLLGALDGESLANGCADLLWGMLASSDGLWAESVAAFTQASGVCDSPEIRYLLSCGMFQLGRYSSALGEIETALDEDPGFADAWFMKAVIHFSRSEEEKALMSLECAVEAKEAGAACHQFLKKNRHATKLDTALAFRHFQNKKKGVLTGGSLRLRNFFRRRILQNIS